MKKIFLLATMVVIAYALQAQNIGFGLKGGLNLNSISNNTSADFSNRLAYHIGGLVHIPVSPQISVQPEVVYSSQGAKYTVGNGQEHSLALNYVNIPLMLQANVGRGFYAEVGPQLGLLTGVADKVNDVETGFFTSDDFKKSDVSLGLGLGYAGTSGIGVDARYNLGLTNFNDAGSTNLKNNVFQLGLFLRLNGRR